MDNRTDFQHPSRTDPRLSFVVNGHYQLGDLLGISAMGSVYRAKHVAEGEEVAIRILTPNLAFDPRVRHRFEDEALHVAGLRHTNCAAMLDFGYDSNADLLYLVFDYVDGVPLSRFLGQAVPLHGALNVVLQVASSLEHAHSQGIQHRDLKPANIMLDVSERGDIAHVLDFGLVHLFEEISERSDGSPLTADGEVYGSPAYMSPEQCRGELDVTASTDVYSLGCIAFALIEGHLPFEGSDVQDLLRAQRHDPVPPLRTPGVPFDVVDLVVRMLAKEPADRPTAAEVVTTFEEHVHSDVSLGFALGKVDRRDLEAESSVEEIDAADPETIEFDLNEHNISDLEEELDEDLDEELDTELGQDASEAEPDSMEFSDDFAPPRLVETAERFTYLGDDGLAERTQVGFMTNLGFEEPPADPETVEVSLLADDFDLDENSEAGLDEMSGLHDDDVMNLPPPVPVTGVQTAVTVEIGAETRRLREESTPTLEAEPDEGHAPTAPISAVVLALTVGFLVMMWFAFGSQTNPEPPVPQTPMVASNATQQPDEQTQPSLVAHAADIVRLANKAATTSTAVELAERRLAAKELEPAQTSRPPESSRTVPRKRRPTRPEKRRPTKLNFRY